MRLVIALALAAVFASGVRPLHAQADSAPSQPPIGSGETLDELARSPQALALHCRLGDSVAPAFTAAASVGQSALPPPWANPWRGSDRALLDGIWLGITAYRAEGQSLERRLEPARDIAEGFVVVYLDDETLEPVLLYGVRFNPAANMPRDVWSPGLGKAQGFVMSMMKGRTVVYVRTDDPDSSECTNAIVLFLDQF